MRTIFALTLMLMVLASGPTNAAGSAEPLGATVDGLIAYALKNNPGLAAVSFEADAASERIAPAGALPAPSMRAELPFGRGKDMGAVALPKLIDRIQISQTFPLWGKRELMRGIAEAEAGAARAQAASERAALIADIKTAYIKYALLVRTRRTSLDILALLAQAEKLATERYATDAGELRDSIGARTQVAQLRSEIAAQESELRQARARLNTLLGRAPMAPLAAPHEDKVVPPSAERIYVGLAERLRAANPSLIAQTQRVNASELRRELAERNRYPDLTIGISFLQAMVELINLPLQQESLRAQIREAETMVSAEKARKDELQNRLFNELIEHLASVDASGKTSRINRTVLLPQARLNFKAATADYRLGEGQFNTVLDSRIQILKTRLEQFRTDAEQQVHLTAIERLLGAEL